MKEAEYYLKIKTEDKTKIEQILDEVDIFSFNIEKKYLELEVTA